jgi:hypothetical protein
MELRRCPPGVGQLSGVALPRLVKQHLAQQLSVAHLRHSRSRSSHRNSSSNTIVIGSIMTESSSSAAAAAATPLSLAA